MTVHQHRGFYLAAPHPCSYLPGKTAANLFADPATPMDMERYSALARLGFRRSGPLVYRPHCLHCSACLPVRIPAKQFKPNRNQQRTWKRNQNLHVTRRAVEFRQDHFELFCRYLTARHPNGGMDNSTPEEYLSFIASPWSKTSLIEFYDAEQLLGVAILDILADGLSAVYSFFDPNEKKRSLGVYMILWEINEAKQLGAPYVYLGYWIKTCKKMGYKSAFRPFEVYQDGKWSIFQETC